MFLFKISDRTEIETSKADDSKKALARAGAVFMFPGPTEVIATERGPLRFDR